MHNYAQLFHVLPLLITLLDFQLRILFSYSLDIPYYLDINSFNIHELWSLLCFLYPV